MNRLVSSWLASAFSSLSIVLATLALLVASSAALADRSVNPLSPPCQTNGLCDPHCPLRDPGLGCDTANCISIQYSLCPCECVENPPPDPKCYCGYPGT